MVPILLEESVRILRTLSISNPSVAGRGPSSSRSMGGFRTCTARSGGPEHGAALYTQTRSRLASPWCSAPWWRMTNRATSSRIGHC